MNKNKLVKYLLNLIKINSETGNEKEISNYVSLIAKKMGYKVHKDKLGNIFISPKTGVAEIVLLAHLDTTPSSINVKPTIKNGMIKSSLNKILGADDKAGVAIILDILDLISKENSKFIPFEVIFTVGAGDIFKGANNFDYKKISAKQGILLDGQGDPGNFTISSPDYINLEYILSGSSYHTTNLGDGANVLYVVSKAISSLPIGHVNKNTISNLVIFDQGSTRRNITPAQIIINGEIRSFSKENILKYSKIFDEKFSSLAKENNLNFKKNNFIKFKGYNIKNKIFLDKLKKASDKIKVDFSLNKTWRGSDANVFNNKGFNIVEMGIGVIDANTENERIRISSIIKSRDLLLKILSKENKKI